MGSSFILGIAFDLSRTGYPYFRTLIPSKIAWTARWAPSQKPALVDSPPSSAKKDRDTSHISPYFPYYKTHFIKWTILIWKLYFFTARRDIFYIFIYLYYNFIFIYILFYIIFILRYIFHAKTKQILSAYFIFFFRTLHEVNENLWTVFPTI